MSSNAPDDLLIGTPQRRRFDTGRLLAGRYEIAEPIGEGGTAEVYSARDHRLERMVAVKVLRRQFGQDPNARARFAVEARAAAGLAVPNIVPIYDFGAADDGSLYIVMRLIDGPSLRSILTENGRLGEDVVVEIARQIAEALAAAHASGLIHRDVKPGNILIDAHGEAHLTDFGTVKALGGADQLTRSGTIFGTAAYLAPEQATGRAIDPRTDIYALGVVMYEALAGQPPFSGDDPVAVSYRHAHESPPALSFYAPQVDPELERLVMACLEKDPANRPQDGHALAAALRQHQVSGSQAAATGAAIAAVAASVPDPRTTSFAPRQTPREPTKETAPIPSIADAPTMLGAAPVAMAGPATAEAPVPGPTVPYIQSAGVAAAPAVMPGVVSGAHPATRTRTKRQKSPVAGLVGTLLVLLAAAVVAVLAAVAILRPGDSSLPPGGVVAATLPPLPSVPAVAVVPPEESPFPTSPLATLAPAITAAPPEVTAAPVPTVEPPAPTAEPLPPTAEPPAPPAPTREPRPDPTPEPPAPTREPRPDPTPEPPAPTPEPPPPAPSTVSVRIPDRLFEGAFPDNTYHGRSASWVYGQGTAYHTMTASFALASAPDRDAPARLDLVGLDGENPAKNEMRLVVNGVTIYSGPNPLPDDSCCGGTGPGNWGTASFVVPAGVLRRENTITITNLEPNDCTNCPKYVMVDYAELTFTTRQ